MTILARTATTTLSAIVVAASMLVSGASHQAEAGKKERLIGAGLIAGVVGTAIIADGVKRSKRRAYDQGYNDGAAAARYDGGGWNAHVRRCYAAYASYNHRTDTYTTYSGKTRRCTK